MLINDDPNTIFDACLLKFFRNHPRNNYEDA